MKTAIETSTVFCGRCSRSTEDPARDKWVMRPKPVVVQGVTIGLCRSCANGSPDAAENRRCNGNCGGAFKSDLQPHYIAEWGDPRIGKGESWACWDRECVDSWANEQDSDCGTCGHFIDIDVYEVVDGKRKREMP